MNLLEFFQALYPESEKSTYLWTLPKKITYKFGCNDLQAMANKALELSAKQQNVYFGVGTHTDRLKFNERPHNEQVTSITALWVDLDIAGGGHAADNLPPNVEDAMELLPYNLPPSIIVHSGFGLHAYWLLREEWELADDTERNNANALLSRLQSYIRNEADKKGWKVDATADLARVLRCPDTLNYKFPDKPALCQVIESSDVRYNPSDFDELPDVVQAVPVGTNGRTEKFERRETDGPAKLMSQCAFLRYCELNPSKINYSEWVAALSNIVRATDGINAAHQFSALDANRYKAKDTDAKINECLSKMNPQSCAYIMSDLGFKGCPDGGCGVKAPCGWSLGKVPRAIATIRGVASISADTVFTKPVIEALGVLETANKLEFGKFMTSCRGQINVNDLKAAIKQQGKTQTPPIDIPAEGVSLSVGQKLGDVTTLKSVLDAPLDLALPANFSFGENGIYYRTETAQGNPKFVRAAGVPAIITERIYNIDTGIEKMEIAFKYFNIWKRVIQPKQNYFVAKNITCLTNYGLNLTSETAKYMVRFLSELESANLSRIPLVYAISHMGWRNDFAEFLTPTNAKYKFDLDDGGEITEAFVQRGSLQKWLETSREVRKYPAARFVLAAALAAPLLKVFNHRNFMIYFWGTSTGGKTAAMTWAMSAWGVASDLMVNFNLSLSGLEGRLALASDLPAGINERQAAGGGKDKQEWLERIVYMIEGGRGKARATPTGIRKTLSWRTIGIACGEEPLSRESSIQGVKTRLLEFNVFPVLDIELAKLLYQAANDNCGWAGPAFTDRLIIEIKNDSAGLHQKYTDLQKILTDEFTDYFSVHIDAVTLVCLADCLSSQWLFGMPKAQAEQEAYSLAVSIIQELPTKRQISDVERGWDFIQNWLSANKMRFEQPFKNAQITPSYGFIKDSCTCVYPEPLTHAMVEAGFSPDKLLKEFANMGRIASEQDGIKRRFRILTRFNGVRTRVIKIPVNLSDDLFSGDVVTGVVTGVVTEKARK